MSTDIEQHCAEQKKKGKVTVRILPVALALKQFLASSPAKNVIKIGTWNSAFNTKVKLSRLPTATRGKGVPGTAALYMFWMQNRHLRDDEFVTPSAMLKSWRATCAAYTFLLSLFAVNHP